MATLHLAFDLGASSGRAIGGKLEGGRLSVEELHRFEHHPSPTPQGPVWDLTGLWLNILEGLRKGAEWSRQTQLPLTSVGVDTWGVDWCLIGESGELLGLPHCYRDPANNAACQDVLARVGGARNLYSRNGIQLLPFNSLFQLAARYAAEPKMFAAAERLLFLPDLFHYWLSGNAVVESTIASTSALLKLDGQSWDRELLESLGIPHHFLGKIVPPGTEVGKLRLELAERCQLSPEVRVVSPGSHDTAAAVAAVPHLGEMPNWAYLSSGTWSLLGAELDAPLVSDASFATPFTNELGVGGKVRFLKNIAGLWLVQELKRDFESRGKMYDFSHFVELAREAEPFRTLVNPNLPLFATPGQMIGKIQQVAKETGQPVPESAGELVRCCLESLALLYRETLDRLEAVLGHSLEKLYIVGGGVQNQLLNELTVAAVERPVVCGPSEATAIGNLLVQALGCGAIGSLRELREVVANSIEIREYCPSLLAPIELGVFERFRQML
jgi:rhamnulokinase